MSTIQLPERQGLGTQKLILAYLATPNLIFLIGFIRTDIGLPLTILSLLVLRRVFRSNAHAEPAKGWIQALIPTTFLLLLAGLPYGGNTYDWIKHWALINHMVDYPWPTSIQLDGREYWLRYYIGAYLPPSLVSKYIPALAPPLTTTAWLGIGFLLLFRSLIQLGSSTRTGMVIACGVLLVSGLDYFVRPSMVAESTEWSTAVVLQIPLQISSPLTQLVWAPNQGIAAMLVGLLIGFDREPGYGIRIGIAMCLLLLWSPFAVIGLVPVAAWVIGRDFDWRNGAVFAFHVLPFLAVALVVVAYMANASSARPYDLASLPERMSNWQKYLTALSIELLPLVMLLRRQALTAIPLISVTSIIGLALVTGPAADMVMRGSAGPVFLISALAMTRLSRMPLGTPSKSIPVALALAAMITTTCNEVLYLITKNHAPQGACNFNSAVYERSYTPEQFLRLCNPWLAPQYFSDQKPWILR